jgi:hypothetical protein
MYTHVSKCKNDKVKIFKMCCSLDLECAPRDHGAKDLHDWEVVEIVKKWSLVGGFKSFEVCPRRGLWDTGLFLSLTF